jgi:transposase
MTVILFSKIRRMYFRDKLSINEIARRTSLSRNTVKKWLRMPSGTDPVYKRRPSRPNYPHLKISSNERL